MSAEAARRERIVEMVRRQGFASIETLAQELAVTPQTIRRDINALCGKAVLRRYHGGAGLPSSVENLAYPTRQVLHLEEKRRIARLLARHVPDGASLLINIGTTTEEVAKALLDHAGLRVITNNLNVAAMLAGKPDFQVIVAGGTVRPRDRGIVGEAAIDLIRQFKVDYGIIGISGVDLDGTLLDFDYQEVRVAQAIIDSSRKVYLAADSSKFGRSALVRLGSLARVDALFTNAEPPAPIRELMRAEGKQLLVAG
jgi:DeoR family transcriptional regulator, glycerol-3-phosphate regulon repressor